jgi:hypothetical protein
MISGAIAFLWELIADVTPGSFWQGVLLVPTEILYGFFRSIGL